MRSRAHLHLQMLPPAAVSGGNLPGVELPGDCSETGMSGGLDLSNDPAGRWPHMRRLRHTGDTHQLHGARRRLAYPIAGKPVSR